MTDTLSYIKDDIDTMKTRLANDAAYRETGVRSTSDSVSLGYNTTLIDGTTLRDILAAPGAGYHWEIRRIMVVNGTTAETPIIVVQDEVPTELFRAAPGSQIDGQPAFDTGWMQAPIVAATNDKIQGKATTATGDTTVYVWAEKVAD